MTISANTKRNHIPQATTKEMRKWHSVQDSPTNTWQHIDEIYLHNKHNKICKSYLI